MRPCIIFLGTCAALVMCAVSTAMNYLFLCSFGKTALEGQVLGIASAAADMLKALLPFFVSWSWQARRYLAALCGLLAFVFFAGFSLLSAIGFAADNRGALVDAKDDISAEYHRMQRSRDDAEARLAALPVHRPAAVVAAEIELHRQNRRWSASKDCIDATEPQSRLFCAEYFRLRSELAAANEDQRLASQIASLQRAGAALREKGAAQDSDPQVSLLSRITGANPDGIRLTLIIAVALLVEIGASLGLYLAAGHGVTRAVASKDGSSATDDHAREPVGMIEDFVLEALTPSKAAILSLPALRQGYRQWCEEAGRSPLQTETFDSGFAELAAAAGVPRAQGGWRGIALKHDKAALNMVS